MIAVFVFRSHLYGSSPGHVPCFPTVQSTRMQAAEQIQCHTYLLPETVALISPWPAICVTVPHRHKQFPAIMMQSYKDGIPDVAIPAIFVSAMVSVATPTWMS
jgi:hypothetical protein